MIKEPMLAAKEKTSDDLIKRLRFPCLGSPKLDGIRAIVEENSAHEYVVLSRKLKPIPNRWVQDLFGHSDLFGLDGELIVSRPEDIGSDPAYPGVFEATMSGCMSIDGKPRVAFHVFDDFSYEGVFAERLRNVSARMRNSGTVLGVPHEIISDGESLLAFHETCILRGYEGSMYRDPHGPYKFGRATAREGWLFKLKDFEDDEAVITGVYPMYHNANVRQINELGRTKRSSHAANQIELDTLGGFDLRRPDGVTFRCGMGPGLTAARRLELWAIRDSLTGLTVKYSYMKIRSTDKPSHPKFLGFRDERD